MQRDVNEFRCRYIHECVIMYYLDLNNDRRYWQHLQWGKKKEKEVERIKKEREDIIEIHNAVDVGGLQVRWRMRVEEKGGEAIRVD